MADDKLKVGSPDTKRINLNQPHEVKYWIGALQCTEEELRAAVQAVGTLGRDVRAHLRRHAHPH